MESSSLSSSDDISAASASASASAASTEATTVEILPVPVGNQAVAAAEEEEDTEFGPRRPDMGTESLEGTVSMHDRHVVLCHKSPTECPAMAQGEESDRLQNLLAAEIEKGQNAMTRKARLTLYQGEDGIEISNGDVLIFPDMIKYRHLTYFEVPNFVEEVLIHDTVWRVHEPKKLSGSFVFVCCHGSGDRKCGVYGPALIERFKEEIATRGLQDRVYVCATSHLCLHIYPGNIIIYSTNLNGEETGHWYAHVNPEDVPILLEQIGKGRVVEHPLRGQMGLSEADQKAACRQLDGEIAYGFVETTNSDNSFNENGHTLPESIEATNTDGSFHENRHTSPESIEETKIAAQKHGQLDGEIAYEFVEATNSDGSFNENGRTSPESIEATNTTDGSFHENGHASPESIEATKIAAQKHGQLDGEIAYEFVEATNTDGSFNENGHTSPESIEVTKTDDTADGIDSVNGTDCHQVLPQNEGLRNHDASVQEAPDIAQRDDDENNKSDITEGARKAVISPKFSRFGCWQQEHTYTTITVVTAIASVAIAYTCYRQLKSK